MEAWGPTRATCASSKICGREPVGPRGAVLLGFQYLMENYRDAAKVELLQRPEVDAAGHVGGRLLTQAGGTVPADIGQQQSQPIAAEKGGTAQATSPEGAKAPDSAVPAAAGRSTGPAATVTLIILGAQCSWKGEWGERTMPQP